MRTLVLDASTLEPFEIGARLMAILAFPSADDVHDRTAAADAFCAEQLLVTEEANPALGAELRDRLPHYPKFDRRMIRKRLRKTFSRYRDRMVAARIARGFLQEAFTHAPAVLPDVEAAVTKQAIGTPTRC